MGRGHPWVSLGRVPSPFILLFFRMGGSSCKMGRGVGVGCHPRKAGLISRHRVIAPAQLRVSTVSKSGAGEARPEPPRFATFPPPAMPTLAPFPAAGQRAFGRRPGRALKTPCLTGQVLRNCSCPEMFFLLMIRFSVSLPPLCGRRTPACCAPA